MVEVLAPSQSTTADTGSVGATRRWNLSRLQFPALVVLLSIFALAPLFHPLYFWGAHDARHSVYFLVEFDRSVQDGILYPRWAPDFTFGYGYPIFNIYAPLAFFAGEAFHLMGLGFVEAVKMVFGLGIVLSGLAMYLFARDFFGPRGALLASVVYVYVPYRIVDIYVRGALSESLSFAFFPLVLWAFRRVAIERRPGKVVLAALSLAGLILANNTQAMLFMPLLAAFCAWTACSERQGPISGIARACVWMGAAGVLAIGLSAIFWLPMVAEYPYVRTDQWTTADYDYRGHFVYLYQLFSPFWGYGISKPGPVDGMPFQLGVVAVILALFGLWRVAGGGSRVERGGESPRPLPPSTPYPLPYTLFFALASLVAIILMLPASAGVWEALRIAVFAQFPWRLLSVTAFSLAFLSGEAVVGSRDGLKTFAALSALLIAVLFSSFSYLSPQFIEPAEGPVSLGGLMRFQQSSGELVGLTKWNREKPKDSPLMPLYLAGQPITSKVVPESLPPGASAKTIRRTTTLDEVKVSSPGDMQLMFYTQAYPGWRAYVDGRPVEIEPAGKLGLISIKAPAGEHNVLLRFETTTPRLLGGIISGLSLALIAALGLWQFLARKAAR